jgi:hypothetical protein
MACGRRRRTAKRPRLGTGSRDRHRVRETTGNNRYQSGKPGHENGPPNSASDGPFPDQNNQRIRRSTPPQSTLKQLPRHHHSLDLVGALVDLGDLRGHGKGHRYSRTGPPIALRIGVLMPCPVPGRTDQRLPRRPGLVSQRQGVLLAGNVKDNLRLPRFDGPCCCIGSPALAARTGLRSLAPSPHQVLRGCAVRPGRLAAGRPAGDDHPHRALICSGGSRTRRQPHS